MHGNGHADSLDRVVIYPMAGVFLLPADQLPPPADQFLQPAAVHHAAGEEGVLLALMNDVFQPQLTGVHPQLPGQVTDRSLQAIDHLGRAKAPEGARRHQVGVGGPAGEPLRLAAPVDGHGIAAAHVQFVNLVLVVGDVVGHFPVPVLGYNRTNGGGKLDTGVVQRTDVAGQFVAET